jgi:hypothetical protein
MTNRPSPARIGSGGAGCGDEGHLIDAPMPFADRMEGSVMPKRKPLAKNSVRTGANSAPEAVVVGPRREVLNPGPSKDAIELIQQIERSSLRAQQRLGMTRLV